MPLAQSRPPHKVIGMPYHRLITNAFKPSPDASAAVPAHPLKRARGYPQEH